MKRIRPSEARQAQRLARIRTAPYEELTPSERDERRDLIDKYSEPPDSGEQED